MRRYSTGEVIGHRYIVTSLLGEGGLGSVYLCQESDTERYVAVKVMRPEATLEFEETIEILKREAQVLSKLRHQNIVQIYDFIQNQYGPTFVMEYVNGYTLCDPALQGPYEFDSFLGSANQCLEGLAAAHRMGVLHLDIKPENIMMTFGEENKIQIKLLDFGIARLTAEMQEPDQTGDLIGSVYYLAPEQVTRKPQNEATDLYSLGHVFYYMLTGVTAYQTEDVGELLRQKVHEDAPDIRYYREDLPEAFVHWLHRLIDRDPANRPQTCQEAVKELTAISIKHTLPPAPPEQSQKLTIGRRITQALKDVLDQISKDT